MSSHLWKAIAQKLMEEHHVPNRLGKHSCVSLIWYIKILGTLYFNAMAHISTGPSTFGHSAMDPMVRLDWVGLD